jgi:F-type H+-transporting ATPase subunit epsilon
MHVEILSPEAQVFNGEATYVGLPGSDGSLGILRGHAPLITSLRAGKVLVRTEKGEELFEVKGGSVEVLNDKVTILAE